MQLTEDSLCDVLTDLGAARKDKALAEEAIAACQEALVIFRDRKMDDLTAGSEKNLAEAQALLADLNLRRDVPISAFALAARL